VKLWKGWTRFSTGCCATIGKAKASEAKSDEGVLVFARNLILFLQIR
jgi:hypothetical protein